ncbi:hypothetical protein FANTH_14671, partial [Fusarium anthophilum]
MERVKDALRKSPGQIHFQYDGWKSGNRHALYGITCVFRDSNNRPQKCVLGLPELTERHTGENIAGQIIDIIREYEFSDKLGYFTLDNAGNNRTSMGELGLEFGFDWEKRWVRCIGHVVNIVVKQMLEGASSLEEVSRSDTWTDMLKKVQAVESQLSDDAQLKKHRPVGVVVDNATRWLSQFSMIERALVLRPFYNSFVQRASNEWEKVNLTRAGHIKKGSKLPFFLKEENRMTPDDWHVLGTLYDILLDFQLVVRGLEGDGQGKHRRKVEEIEIDPPLSAWRTKKRGRMTGGISVTESPIRSPAQSPRSSVGGLDLDEYEQWQRDIEDADASVTDPYEYWHIRRLKYPRLSRMALDLLTVPPMSAERERLFSTTGRMVTKSRNRLDAISIHIHAIFTNVSWSVVDLNPAEPYTLNIEGSVVTTPNSHKNWIKSIPTKRHGMQWPIRSMLWIRSDLEAEQVPIPSADLTGAILRWPDREVLVVSVYVAGKDEEALRTAMRQLHATIGSFRNSTGKRTDDSDVQSQTDRLMDVVLDAIHDLVPRAKPSMYAKRWWTTDLTKLRRTYTFWRNLARARRRAGQRIDSLEDRAKETGKEYHDAMKRQKKTHWDDFLADGTNIWQAAKYLKPGHDANGDKVPPLKRTDGTTTQDKVEQ